MGVRVITVNEFSRCIRRVSKTALLAVRLFELFVTPLRSPPSLRCKATSAAAREMLVTCLGGERLVGCLVEEEEEEEKDVASNETEANEAAEDGGLSEEGTES